MNLRNTPEIRFVLDQSIEYGVAMSKKIDDITKRQEKEEEYMVKLYEVLKGAKRAGIAGHVRPDGDCTGSCLALYQYIGLYFSRSCSGCVFRGDPEFLPHADRGG